MAAEGRGEVDLIFVRISILSPFLVLFPKCVQDFKGI